jgi:hypothetical protein
LSDCNCAIHPIRSILVESMPVHGRAIG